MTGLTTTEAADRLGVTRQRVDSLVREGKLRAERVGRPVRLMVNADDVDARALLSAARPGEVSVTGAAARRGVHPDTIRSWIAAGLHAQRRMGRYFIRAVDLDQWEPNPVGRPPGGAE